MPSAEPGAADLVSPHPILSARVRSAAARGAAACDPRSGYSFFSGSGGVTFIGSTGFAGPIGMGFTTGSTGAVFTGGMAGITGGTGRFFSGRLGLGMVCLR